MDAGLIRDSADLFKLEARFLNLDRFAENQQKMLLRRLSKNHSMIISTLSPCEPRLWWFMRQFNSRKDYLCDF